VDEFLRKVESVVPEQQQFDALKWALHATPTQWWGTHQGNFEDWCGSKRIMHVHFGKPQIRLVDKYVERDDPCTHLAKWTKVYGEESQPEWVHLLYHTLDIIPMNWYIETELYHGTGEWDVLCEGFLLTFTFEGHWSDTIDDALQVVKAAIFKIPQELMGVLRPEWATQLSSALECYNMNVEEDDEDP